MNDTVLPQQFHDWFVRQGWQVRDHQLRMVDAFMQAQSTLLIAPTGGGKTLAGLLPSLVDLSCNKHSGLHTLYISPLKALTNDIHRNLHVPINDMELSITVETRTGDTPSHKRKRQRETPPHILLTTPESLMLMLSYVDAPKLFGSLKVVVIDEIHSFAPNKRGDFMSLALARLQRLAPSHIRFGLSATVAQPLDLSTWLGVTGSPASLIEVAQTAKPQVEILPSAATIPYSGFMAKYAVPAMYAEISAVRTSIIFVNTRAQAELMFQLLWEENYDGLPIALYHGSLSKEQRRKTEALMANGTLRCVVATSALELGIDWGDVELVMQIGAPKGVSRLLQRIGRSNHRMDTPSKAFLVPANRFEVLECSAAIAAIDADMLDGEPLLPGSDDVLVQYIINCACSAAVTLDDIHAEILNAPPYQAVSKEKCERLFEFAVNGGYVLQHYDRYERLSREEDSDAYRITSRFAAQRHRQNIGVIVEAARLNVKRMNPKRGGRIIGHVEEGFAQQLTPGDTFYFAGEVLEYITIRDMVMEARPSPAKEPKIPSYSGGQMPLSTFLADGVRALLQEPDRWNALPKDVSDWLALQQRYSVLPNEDMLLVEHFPRAGRQFSIIYTFEGRKANQTLGMLMTRRMERMMLQPISFSVTDYALSIMSLVPIDATQMEALLCPDILLDDLEEWIVESPMLKRSFRRVAMITGLTEQRMAGNHKSMKQVTFSTDLIYDVLRRHEPNHILLWVTRADAERELLDIRRLADMLVRFERKIRFHVLEKPSPMAIPILADVRREAVKGSGIEGLLDAMTAQEKAQEMMEAYAQPAADE